MDPDTSNSTEAIIESLLTADRSVFSRIPPNATTATKSHQCGFPINGTAASMFFKKKISKQTSLVISVSIQWPDGRVTDSKFHWYASKLEGRITCFGRGFPFRDRLYSNGFLILRFEKRQVFADLIPGNRADVEAFLDAMSFVEASPLGVFTKGRFSPIDANPTNRRCNALVAKRTKTISEFPSTKEVASLARNIVCQAYPDLFQFRKTSDADRLLELLIKVETNIFFNIELNKYPPPIKFNHFLLFYKEALSAVQTRKSRAGHSLEHHLFHIFEGYQISFDKQAITEARHQPDFLFPSKNAYDKAGKRWAYNEKFLTVLAAKTTCKDRWRQILKEADKTQTKYLFTLDTNISEEQLKEMYDSHVVLVMPSRRIKLLPKAYQKKVLCLSSFISLLRAKARKRNLKGRKRRK